MLSNNTEIIILEDLHKVLKIHILIFERKIIYYY